MDIDETRDAPPVSVHRESEMPITRNKYRQELVYPDIEKDIVFKVYDGPEAAGFQEGFNQEKTLG